jgi:hypothetical protein
VGPFKAEVKLFLAQDHEEALRDCIDSDKSSSTHEAELRRLEQDRKVKAADADPAAAAQLQAQP